MAKHRTLKRALSILLVLCFVMSLFTVSAFADNGEKVGEAKSEISEKADVVSKEVKEKETILKEKEKEEELKPIEEAPVSLVSEGAQINGADDPVSDGGEEQPRGNRTAYNLNDIAINVVASLLINGSTPTPNQELEDGDTFAINLSWDLPSNARDYTSEDTFVYDIGFPPLQLSEASGSLGTITVGGEAIDVGTYTMSGNTITVQYTDEFLALDERTTEVWATGTIDVTLIPIGTIGEYTITLPGAVVVVIPVRDPNGLQIEKTYTKHLADDTTNTVTVDYCITVTSLRDNTNVKIVDQLLGKFADGSTSTNENYGTYTISNVHATYTPVGGTEQTFSLTSGQIHTGTHPLNGTVYKPVNGTFFTASGQVFHTGDVLKFYYTVSYVEPVYKTTTEYKNTDLFNTVTAESKESDTVSGSVHVYIKNCWIYKTGSKSGDNITWTIIVKRGEFETLELHDTLGAHQNIADNAVVTVYSAQTLTGTWTQLATYTWAQLSGASGVPLIWNAEDEEDALSCRIIQFTTTVDGTTVANYTNDANIISPEKHYDAIVTASGLSPTIVNKLLLSATLTPDYTTNANYASNRYIVFRSQITATVSSEAEALGADFYIDDAPTCGMTSSEAGALCDAHDWAVTNHDGYPLNPGSSGFSDVVESIVNQDGVDCTSLFNFKWVSNGTSPNGFTWPCRLRIYFKGGNVVPGTYTIILKTRIKLTDAMGGAVNVNGEGAHSSATDISITNTVYWPTASGTENSKNWSGTSHLSPIKKTAYSIWVDQDEYRYNWVYKITVPDLHYTFTGNGVTGNNVSLDIPASNWLNDEVKSVVYDRIPSGWTFEAAAWDEANFEDDYAGKAVPVSESTNSSGQTTYGFEVAGASRNLYVKIYKDNLYNYEGEGSGNNGYNGTRTTNVAYLDLKNPKDTQSVGARPYKLWTSYWGYTRPQYGLLKRGSYTTGKDYVTFLIHINTWQVNMIPDVNEITGQPVEDQTFSLVDRMGDALEFDLDRIKINTVQDQGYAYFYSNEHNVPLSEYMAEHPEMTLTVDEDGHGFRIDGLQDKQIYHIVYAANITINPGEELNAIFAA